MQTRDTVTVADLRREAQHLRQLLDWHRADAEAASRPQATRFLYFIDAQDLKHYINPRRADRHDGFMLDVERAAGAAASADTGPQQDEDVPLSIRLKSDRLLHQLLFQNPEQVGILPSHAALIEDEIEYHAHRLTKQLSGLGEEARREVARLVRSDEARRIAAFIRERQHLPGEVRQVLTFLGKAAPALLAVLRPARDTPRARIAALGRDCRLRSLHDLDWRAFGIPGDVAATLRQTARDPERVLAWLTYLDECRPDQGRTNRMAAEALAILEPINKILEKQPGPPVRALLVTRVRSLHQSFADRGNLRQHRLDVPDCVRHPRLLVVNRAGGDQALSAKPERALGVALTPYAEQLRALDGDAGTTAMQQAVQPLLVAWQSFENAHFAGVLHAEPEAGEASQLDSAEIERLLDWFRNERGVLGAVRQQLVEAIQEFGQATYALRTRAGPAIRARLEPRHGACRIVPLSSGLPGPLVLHAPVLQRDPAVREVDLGDLAVALKTEPTERYLVWSLLSACQGEWDLAGTYAQSAIELAAVLDKADAVARENEARLLRAQIRRLSGEIGEHSRKPHGARQDPLDQAHRDLDRISTPRDPRVLCERAALWLEGQLTGRRSPTTEPVQAIRDALAALREYPDPILEARCLAIGLTTYLMELPPFGSPVLIPKQEEAALWHRQLVAVLASNGQSSRSDAEPFARARALEIIGYQVAPWRSGDLAPAQELAVPEPQLRIPADLRDDVNAVHELLQSGKDEIVRRLTQKLHEIAQSLERSRERALIYTPAWAAAPESYILPLFDGEPLYERAAEIYGRLRSLTEETLRIGVSKDQRGLMEALQAELAALRGELPSLEDAPAAPSRWRDFFLRMDQCCVRLLLSWILPSQRKRALLQELDHEYARIAEQFPDAAVPLLRREVVLMELHSSDSPEQRPARRAAALELIRQAVALMKSDPTLPDKSHWILSTMRRRLGRHFADAARSLLPSLLDGTADAAIKDAYVANLQQALDAVVTDLPSQPRVDRGNDPRSLEAERRFNNVVYYGTLLLAADPDGRTLPAGCDKPFLAGLASHLHRRGIDRMEVPNIVHTVGAFYVAANQPELAAAAAERFFVLLASGEVALYEGNIAANIADAVRWRRARTTGGTLPI